MTTRTHSPQAVEELLAAANKVEDALRRLSLAPGFYDLIIPQAQKATTELRALCAAYAVDMPTTEEPIGHSQGECPCGEYHHREDFL